MPMTSFPPAPRDKRDRRLLRQRARKIEELLLKCWVHIAEHYTGEGCVSFLPADCGIDLFCADAEAVVTAAQQRLDMPGWSLFLAADGTLYLGPNERLEAVRSQTLGQAGS